MTDTFNISPPPGFEVTEMVNIGGDKNTDEDRLAESVVDLALGDDEEAAVDDTAAVFAEDEETEVVVDVSQIVYKNVWKAANEEARAGVKKLWDDSFGDKMPEEIKNKRLDLICVVAYYGEKCVGVSTMNVEMNSNLWVRMGLFRCMVDEHYRRNGIATGLLLECKKALKKYSDEHPGEEIKAIGAIMDAKMFGEHGLKPYWPKTGLTLMSYNEHGMQMRIVWLEDTKVKY